jgi:hypothetical protein
MRRFCRSTLNRVAVHLLAVAGFVSSYQSSAFAQTPPPPVQSIAEPAAVQTPSAQALKEWRRSVAQVPAPGSGCYTATYPSTQWQEIPCKTPPHRPYLPARGLRSGVVGGPAKDVSAVVAGLISVAEGSFDSVTGVTSETGQVNGTGSQVPNTFTLQLNTNVVTGPAACAGAADPKTCLGWQQFIYSNDGYAFIQYWLLDYENNCPSGWTPSGASCWKNSANSPQHIQPQPITNLANMSVAALANVGGKDETIVTIGGTALMATGEANALNLFQSWTTAEFNVFGDGDGTQANFNDGATLVVRTTVDSNSSAPPSCVAQSFTAETNNLNFASVAVVEPGPPPAIVFTESTAGTVTSPCSSAPPGQLLVVSPGTGISATGPQGGAFAPSSFTYQLSAASGCVYFEVENLGAQPGQPPGSAGWFDISPQSGQVCTTPKNITITVNEQAKALPIGTYGPTFVGFVVPDTFGGTSRPATLTVQAPVRPRP